jgi:hypothetical protein
MDTRFWPGTRALRPLLQQHGVHAGGNQRLEDIPGQEDTSGRPDVPHVPAPGQRKEQHGLNQRQKDNHNQVA